MGIPAGVAAMLSTSNDIRVASAEGGVPLYWRSSFGNLIGKAVGREAISETLNRYRAATA